MGSWVEPILPEAINEVISTILPLEKEWDEEKLQKKLKEYFYKASKQLTFKGSNISAAINEYADNAMGSIFAGLGDREWLYTGQADFLLCIDAGVKDTFPGYMFRDVQMLEFEQTVLAAYDRAFDEQRFCPILSEAVPAVVSGPKIKKKVWNAIDQGRKDAVMSGTSDIEEFTHTWINSSIAHLSASSMNHPEATMEPELATKLFQMLLEGGGLPLTLAQEGTLAAPVHLAEEAVTSAYSEHTAADEEKAAAEGGEPPAKKAKGAW